MILLHMLVNKDLSELECGRLNIAYNRLIYQVQPISKRESLLKLNSLHVLVPGMSGLPARMLRYRRSIQCALIFVFQIFKIIRFI